MNRFDLIAELLLEGLQKAMDEGDVAPAEEPEKPAKERRSKPRRARRA